MTTTRRGKGVSRRAASSAERKKRKNGHRGGGCLRRDTRLEVVVAARLDDREVALLDVPSEEALCETKSLSF